MERPKIGLSGLVLAKVLSDDESVTLQFRSLRINQRELHPTELGTLPTVGTTSETML